MNLAVVGGGISAHLFLFTLLKSEGEKLSGTNITQFKGDFFARPCSLNSSAQVLRWGIQSGVSPLGDLLLRALEEVHSFVQAYEPEGIYPLHHQEIYFSQHQDFLKLQQRFPAEEKEVILPGSGKKIQVFSFSEQGLIFNPPVFLDWLQRQIKEMALHYRVKWMIKEQWVNDLSILQSFDKVLFATGAYAKIYNPLTSFPELEKSQVVGGTYWQCAFNGGDENWNLHWEKKQLLFRAFSQSLMMGNTTEKRGAFLWGDRQRLQEDYHLWTQLGVTLPPLTQGSFVTGLRQKGSKRMPFWGQIPHQKNFYAILNLYKNGFSFPFLAASALVKEMT